MSRTWAELTQRERGERVDVYGLLAAGHDVHTDTAVAQLRADVLWDEAVWEIDPTDGYWHERVAAYIAERW